jgi:DNA-binding GntR family transcriptional regulator
MMSSSLSAWAGWTNATAKVPAASKLSPLSIERFPSHFSDKSGAPPNDLKICKIGSNLQYLITHIQSIKLSRADLESRGNALLQAAFCMTEGRQAVKVKTIDIGQMASASDVIFDALRTAITDGSLNEGQVLRQDQIAKMFNTSRIPVREALTRLEEQGLVTTQRYRGAVVAALSIEEIVEIFEFRALVESEVIRRSVSKISDHTLDLASSYCEAFGSATDPSKWGDLNRLFHYTLYSDCGLPYYLQIVNSALVRIERYQRVQLTVTAGMDRARREHQAILEACVRRDAHLAADLTRSHILGASRSLTGFLKEHRGNTQSA